MLRTKVCDERKLYSIFNLTLHPYEWDFSRSSKISTVQSSNGFLPILEHPLPQIPFVPDCFQVVLQKSSRKQHRKVRKSCWKSESSLRAIHHSDRPLKRRSGSLTCSKEVGSYVNFHVSPCNIPYLLMKSHEVQRRPKGIEEDNILQQKQHLAALPLGQRWQGTDGQPWRVLGDTVGKSVRLVSKKRN